MQPTTPSEQQPQQITEFAEENIAALAKIADRDDAQISAMQLNIEKLSAFVGSPTYLAFVVAFILAWLATNTWASHAGWAVYDEAPFFWLQGIVSVNGLLVTLAVLIRQNRMANLARHRAHLDLQINLLTEQKVTKILQALNEIRRDLPMLNTPVDKESEELAAPADPAAILEAIKKRDDRG